MALELNVNSYVELDEATTYFENRVDVAAWDEASEEMREKSLVSATLLLDTYEWIGYVVSESQPLAFPRTGEYYYDPRKGYEVFLEGTPQAIKTAIYEIAYHLLNNDGLLDDTGGVDSISLGPIQLNKLSTPSKIPAWIYRTLRPLLARGGRREWFRAN
jgi:hypothetical protein